MDFTSILSEAASDAPPKCPITGSPDLYGLGIRLGIYFQMLMVQTSGLLKFVLNSEDNIAETAVVFVFSVAIVLIRQISTHSLNAVEVVPILTLLMALVNSYQQVDQLKGLPRLLLAVEFAGLAGIMTWFWWYGMDQLPRDCEDDKAFFFAQVSIWGWFRTFNKVLTVFTALTAFALVIRYLMRYGYKLVLGTIFFIARLRGEKNVPSLSSEGEDEEIKEAQHSLDLALNIGVILFVELTLRWNEIQGVHKLADPGQFMPFFIGLAQFLAVLYRYVSRATRESERADRGGIDGQPFEENELECTHTESTNGLTRLGLRKREAHDDVAMTNV